MRIELTHSSLDEDVLKVAESMEARFINVLRCGLNSTISLLLIFHAGIDQQLTLFDKLR